MLRHQLSQKLYNVIGASFETIEHGDGGARTTVRWRPDGDTGRIECGVMSVVDSINNALSIGVIKTAVNVNLLMNVV